MLVSCLGASRAGADDIAVTKDLGLPLPAGGWKVVGTGDFNGDGKLDLVWRRQDDSLEARLWLLDGGGNVLQDVGLPLPAPGWKVVGVGDFNGDGKSDLVWRRQNDTLEARIWLLDGATVLQDLPLPQPAAGWRVIGVADFNRDGRSDLLWRRQNDTLEGRIWLLDRGTVLQDLPLPLPADGWKVVGIGDFNGDGRPDLAWRRQDDTLEARLWLLDVGTVLHDVGLPLPASGWKVVGVGDFDGDGRSDLVWRRLDNSREPRLWLLDGGTVLQDVALPLADSGWDVVGIGDFDRNGRADLAWRRVDQTREARLWLLARVSDLRPISVPVTLHPQESTQWCWAASAQMIMDYFGHGVAQCAQANALFGLDRCCGVPLCPTPLDVPDPCARPGWPEFGRWGFVARRTNNTALTLGQLATELVQARPVAFSWGWDGSTAGHMMVARGLYHDADGVAWIDIHDPLNPCQGASLAISYPEYVERHDGAGIRPDHVHWSDHYGVRYAPDEVMWLPPWVFSDAVAGGSTGSSAAASSSVAPQAGDATAASSEGAAPLVRVHVNHGPRAHPTPRVAAAEAVRASSAVLPKIISGLRAADIASGGTVGEPIAVHSVSIDELSSYLPGGDPEELVYPTGAVLMPMLVSGEIRAGVTAAKRDGGYAVVSMASGELADRVARKIDAAPRTVFTGERFLVRIRALRVDFIGWRELGVLMLMPLADDARLGLDSSKPTPAATVFKRLAPFAQKVPRSVPG